MMLRSVFSRRRIKAPVSAFSAAMASASRRAWMGTKKRRLKSAWVPRKPELRNSMINHRSPTLFSTGVPVSATR